MGAKLAVRAVVLHLALSVSAVAQTSTTYHAPTGSVSPALFITMNLSGGGSANLNPVVGPNCYLGMTCGFPAGYVGTNMSYTLADGSTATLPNFNGTFFPLGNNNYGLSGQASGTDSLGRTVTVDNVQVSMHITCRSGRGGGCSKVYTGGTLTVTVNAAPMTPTDTPTPATPAATATLTTTATPTPTPTISAGPLALTLAKLHPVSSATSPNGSATVSGSFAAPAEGSFDPSGGMTIQIQALGFDQTLTWTSDECTPNGAAVRCVSSNSAGRLRVAPARGAAAWWTFKALLTKLAVSGPFGGPVTVTLTQSGEDFVSSGTIATCVSQGATLVCR